MAVSRRSLAKFAASQLALGADAKSLAEKLVAELSISGRMRQSDLLIRDIMAELERRKLFAEATITSAHELSPGIEAAALELIKKLSGAAELSVTKNVSRSVIGGLKIDTPTISLDLTIQNKLKQLRKV